MHTRHIHVYIYIRNTYMNGRKSETNIKQKQISKWERAIEAQPRAAIATAGPTHTHPHTHTSSMVAVYALAP